MSYQFFSAKKLLKLLKKHEIATIAELVVLAENELTKRTPKEIRENMGKRLDVMRKAILESNTSKEKSKSGMSGGDALKVRNYKTDRGFLSPIMTKAVEYALAVMETNARMGRIVAAPTAGSAGIVPGAIIATQEVWDLSEDVAVDGLLTSAGLGIIIAHNATFSAAAAGCQAEIGTSSAMACAAVSAMRGMSPEKILNAAALSLKNMLGLACDPIAGLVESPCVKRNALGVSHAMTASELSNAGIISVVPFDEVVMAMNNVASNMHSNIRETSKGGLAITPTGQKIHKMVFGKNLKSAKNKTEAKHACHKDNA